MESEGGRIKLVTEDGKSIVFNVTMVEGWLDEFLDVLSEPHNGIKEVWVNGSRIT